MRASVVRFGVVVVVGFVWGCGEPPPPPPRGYVSGVVPAQATPGSLVTITGQLMGLSGAVLAPGGKKLRTTNWMPTAINVQLPEDFPVGQTSLEVRTEDFSLGAATVVVLPPAPLIRTLTPEVGMVGLPAQITGRLLGDRSTSKIFVYGAEVKEIKEWTPTRISFVFPPLPAQLGDHAVWIVGPGGRSNLKELAIVRPYASHMVPDPALAGKVVTLHGRDFGLRSGKVVIGNNKQSLEVLEWTEKRIRARLPLDVSGEEEVRVINDNGGSIPMLVSVLAPPSTGRVKVPPGQQVALALDDNDLPHIVTFDVPRNKISLTTWGRSGWTTTQLVVRMGRSTGKMPVAAPDLEDKIEKLMKEHLAKKGDVKELEQKIAAITADAQKAATASPVSINAAGHCPHLVIDAGRRMHLTIFDAFEQKVIYGSRQLEDEEWEFSYVSGPKDKKDGMFSALAVDTRGRPHVAYMDHQRRQVNHATIRDGNWVSELVDPEQDVGVSISLAVDANANPMLAYLDFGKFDLKAAVFDGKEFRPERVDDQGWTGDMPSLEVDEAGQPVIAYMQRSDDGKAPAGVKFAKRLAGKWSVESVDSGPGVGNQPVLKRDATGRYHLAYFDDREKAIRYAVRKGTSGTWAKQSLRVEGLIPAIQPELMAMAVASDGTARTVYWTLDSFLEYRQLVPR